MRGIANQCDRVPAIRLPFPLDHGQGHLRFTRSTSLEGDRLGTWLIPSGVHHQRHVDNTDFVDGRVYIANLPEIDPVVRSPGGQDRLLGHRLIEVLRAMPIVGPQLASADPVALPPLHRASRRGPLILLTGPLIVAAREFIQHARTHPTSGSALMEQKIDDSREGETGAGPFASLVEDFRHKRTVDNFIGEDLQRRMVRPVSNIDLVRKRIERLADFFSYTLLINRVASRRRFRSCRFRSRFACDRPYRFAPFGGHTFLPHGYAPVLRAPSRGADECMA